MLEGHVTSNHVNLMRFEMNVCGLGPHGVSIGRATIKTVPTCFTFFISVTHHWFEADSHTNLAGVESSGALGSADARTHISNNANLFLGPTARVLYLAPSIFLCISHLLRIVCPCGIYLI